MTRFSCNAFFRSKHELDVHDVTQHSQQRRYQCHLCKKTFHRRSVLRDHIERSQPLSLADSNVAQDELTNENNLSLSIIIEQKPLESDQNMNTTSSISDLSATSDSSRRHKRVSSQYNRQNSDSSPRSYSAKAGNDFGLLLPRTPLRQSDVNAKFTVDHSDWPLNSLLSCNPDTATRA